MNRKKCFIVTPIGDDDSEIRRASDGVIDAVISPVMDELEYEIDVAHRMSDAGSITKQVINKLTDSDLVICNLTSLNPNVMYELAVRHAVRKPVVCIAEKGTKIPFDIQEDRIIFYDNDMKGATNLTENLKKVIPKAEVDDNPDNPIYRAIETQSIIKQANIEGGFEEYIVNAIDKLERMVGEIRIDSASRYSTNNLTNRVHYITIKFNESIEPDMFNSIFTRLASRLSAEGSGNYEKKLIRLETFGSTPLKLEKLIINVLNNESDLVEDITVSVHK